MDLQLENKLALVTGSTAGIGLAIADGEVNRRDSLATASPGNAPVWASNVPALPRLNAMPTRAPDPDTFPTAATGPSEGRRAAR